MRTTIMIITCPPLVILAAMLGIFWLAGYGYPWEFIAAVTALTAGASVVALVVEGIEGRR